jgi:Cu/Ag efflux protein CusF
MKSTMHFVARVVCVCLLMNALAMRAAAQQNDLLKSTDVIKQHAAKIGLSDNDLKNLRISDALC